MKLFLDTNILIDKIAARKPYVEDIKTLCIAKYFGDIELYVSIQSYLDAIDVLRNYAPIDSLKKRCISSLKFFEVVDVDKTSLLPALESSWEDVEDFVIAKSASNVHADYLITRDASGFKNSSVKALTPRDFIELLHDEYGIEYVEE